MGSLKAQEECGDASGGRGHTPLGVTRVASGRGRDGWPVGLPETPTVRWGCDGSLEGGSGAAKPQVKTDREHATQFFPPCRTIRRAWRTNPSTRRTPNRPPPRVSRPGEPLWSLRKDGRQITCELRSHGEYGWEAQLFRDGGFYAGRRFDLRAQAVEHAEQTQQDLEREGRTALV